jgi:hypothetical protein
MRLHIVPYISISRNCSYFWMAFYLNPYFNVSIFEIIAPKRGIPYKIIAKLTLFGKYWVSILNLIDWIFKIVEYIGYLVDKL